jgi:succinate dehydrogenase / fumarate reductase cytochrome b subunit
VLALAAPPVARARWEESPELTETVERWVSRHHFLLRRLHSLSGVVPLGLFLVLHLYTNSLAALSHATYDRHVVALHHTAYLLPIEVIGIFLPLAFHAGYGAVIAREGRSNVRQYGWLGNWRYTLQRVSAWVALIFIVIHLVHFRFAHWVGGPAYQETIAAGESPALVTQLAFLQVLPRWGWFAVYAAGLVASVYHFCNGLVTFCITWGITLSDVSRRRVLVGAGALAALLLIWGFASLWALNLRIAPQTPDRFGGPAVAAAAPGP